MSRFKIVFFTSLCFWAAGAYAGDADVKMTTIDGSTKFTWQNSSAVEVSSVTSLGDAYFKSVRIGGILAVSTDTTISAFSTYNTNGLITQTAVDTFTGRTITPASAARMTVTNGDGVSGNPTIDVNTLSNVVTATQTTTLVGPTSVTNMVFNIAANENWNFEFIMQNGCNNTGGLKWTITVPAGATFKAAAMGMSTGVTAVTSSIMSSSGVASIAFNAVNSATGWTWIKGSVDNGGTAGAVTLQYGSTTGGQTSSVFTGSYFNAQRM